MAQCKVTVTHLAGVASIAMALMVSSTISPRALVDGSRADEKDYPATVRFYGAENCTATIVGPRAVLVAAHCVEAAKNAKIELGDKQPSLTCTRHPKHKASGTCDDPKDKACTADLALCKASADLKAPNLKYEMVQIDRSKLKADMSVTLLGYGCTKDGVIEFLDLNAGTSTIKKLSKDEDDVLAADQFLWAIGGAHSCQGDSGAGAFDTSDKKTRFIIGVMAKGTPGAAGKPATTQLVSTSDKRIVDFMKSWGKGNSGAPICGVHATATGCR